MKTNSTILASLLTGAALFATASAQASSTSQTDPLAGGIFYKWTVGMSGSDTAFVTGSVGPWSWQDESLGTDTGWTHESQWLALTLSEPVTLTLQIAAKNDVEVIGQGTAGPDLFPGVTIWSGWDNDAAPTQALQDRSHAYYNRGNVPWAEDLAFFAFIPGGPSQTIEGTFTMPAGQYTLVIGGDGASETGGGDVQGYGVTFTTTPVPEPGSLMLGLVAGLPLLLRRRR